MQSECCPKLINNRSKDYQMNLFIETERLYVVAQTKEMAIASFTDKKQFAELLGAEVPAEWPHAMLADAEPFFVDMLTKDPDSVGWWGWYMVLKSSPKKIIGGLGFLGRPSDTGTVVSGYSILTEFDGNGYTTEALKTLIAWAFKHNNVTSVAAETYPGNTASIRVMEKCGMVFIGNGSEEGTIRYERRK